MSDKDDRAPDEAPEFETTAVELPERAVPPKPTPRTPPTPEEAPK